MRASCSCIQSATIRAVLRCCIMAFTLNLFPNVFVDPCVSQPARVMVNDVSFIFTQLRAHAGEEQQCTQGRNAKDDDTALSPEPQKQGDRGTRGRDFVYFKREKKMEEITCTGCYPSGSWGLSASAEGAKSCMYHSAS